MEILLKVGSIIVAWGIPVLAVVLLAGTWRRLKRGGRGAGTTLLGSAHNILNEDQQRAADVIVEEQAHKKLGSQESGDPEDPAGRHAADDEPSGSGDAHSRGGDRPAGSENPDGSEGAGEKSADYS
ncbi:hypothetical protein ACFL4Y_00045 [Gemmatimonadota bacterium]